MVLQFFKDINSLEDIKQFLSSIEIDIFSYLRKKEKTDLLSIDIGSSQIKVVKIAKRDGELFLEKYYIIPLPSGCMAGHQIKNRNELLNALRKFVQDNNYQGHDTAVVIAGPQIVTQIIKVSNQFADNQLLTHIELEAEKYLPFDVDDLAMDFDVLETGEEEEGFLEILLAAAKKGYVNEFIDLIEEAGLNLRVIDVYSCVMGRLNVHAVASQLGHDIEGKITAMIDIGHEVLTLSIFNKDRQIYIKEQAIGGKDLTDEIIKEHSISYEQAEQLKLKYEDPMIAKISDEFRDKIIKQVYHMLQFFYASAFAAKIDYIFITGGVASLPGLTEALSEKMEIPAYLLDPFELIHIDPLHINQDTDNLRGLSANLSSACGLGIRSHVE